MTSEFFKSKKLLSTWLLMMIAVAVGAQCTVKGVLRDDDNGEPIPFANVVLEGTRHACQTDLNGFFLINRVPSGTYVLRVRYVGYADYTDTITLAQGQSLSHNIALRPASQTLEAVIITDTKAEERRMQTQVSVEKVTATQIQQMPSIGGQADIAQYMQVLPGISSTGDQGGQLYIRGGSMIQNLTLLDGMVVYNPFHSIGLYSIFETDVIRNADIYTGGFGAEYGGRLSSVMDITTRDGNRRHHTGKVGFSTFGANLILEGPLKRERKGSRTSITYLLTAKNSYLSHTSKALYSYIDGGLPFDFLDLYGKVTLAASSGSKASVFGFRFDDRVSGYHALADYHWQNYGAGVNFMAVTGASAVLDGTIAYSDYYITLDDGSGDDKYSRIGGFNASMQLTNFFGQNKLIFGISFEGYNTDYKYTNDFGLRAGQDEPSTNLSIFGAYKINAGRLLVDPGLRVAYYASIGEASPEPRLALKYNATDRLRFKLATGAYSQIFLDARSDNDIVNLFTGFLTGSSSLRTPTTFLGDEVETCVQKAQHLVIGAEYDLTEHITLNIEAYYKNFSQLLNSNHGKIYDEYDSVYQQGGSFEKPQFMLKDYIIEKGHAMGVDLSATVDIERLYLWATYSLGYVERTDEGVDGAVSYNPHYDRRHTVNLLATYALGDQRQWELSGRWTFGSGFPFTQTQGVYEQILFGDGITTDYTRENGEYAIHYADLYQGRMPSYHRLDLGAKRKFSIGKRSTLELNLSVTNVYSRQNIFYFDRTTKQRVNQLPILACFGANFTF